MKRNTLLFLLLFAGSAVQTPVTYAMECDQSSVEEEILDQKIQSLPDNFPSKDQYRGYITLGTKLYKIDGDRALPMSAAEIKHIHGTFSLSHVNQSFNEHPYLYGNSIIGAVGTVGTELANWKNWIGRSTGYGSTLATMLGYSAWVATQDWEDEERNPSTENQSPAQVVENEKEFENVDSSLAIDQQEDQIIEKKPFDQIPDEKEEKTEQPEEASTADQNESEKPVVESKTIPVTPVAKMQIGSYLQADITAAAKKSRLVQIKAARKENGFEKSDDLDRELATLKIENKESILQKQYSVDDSSPQTLSDHNEFPTLIGNLYALLKVESFGSGTVKSACDKVTDILGIAKINAAEIEKTVEAELDKKYPSKKETEDEQRARKREELSKSSSAQGLPILQNPALVAEARKKQEEREERRRQRAVTAPVKPITPAVKPVMSSDNQKRPPVKTAKPAPSTNPAQTASNPRSFPPVLRKRTGTPKSVPKQEELTEAQKRMAAQRAKWDASDETTK